MDGKWRVYNDTKVYDIDSKKKIVTKGCIAYLYCSITLNHYRKIPLGVVSKCTARSRVSRNLATWKPLKQLHGTNPIKPQVSQSSFFGRSNWSPFACLLNLCCEICSFSYYYEIIFLDRLTQNLIRAFFKMF